MLKSNSQFFVSMNPDKILKKTVQSSSKKAVGIKGALKLKPKKQSEQERSSTTPHMRVQIKIKPIKEEKPSQNLSRLNKREVQGLIREVSPKLKRQISKKEEKKVKFKKSISKPKKKETTGVLLHSAKNKKKLRNKKKSIELNIAKRRRQISNLHESIKNIIPRKGKKKTDTEVLNIVDTNYKENISKGEIKDQLELLQCDLIRTMQLIHSGSSNHSPCLLYTSPSPRDS